MGFTYRLELRLKTLKLQLAAEVAIPLEHLYRLYLTTQRLHFLPDCVAKKQNLPSCKNSMLQIKLCSTFTIRGKSCECPTISDLD